MTKILITGITGFVGKVLVLYILLNSNDIIYGIIRDKKSSKKQTKFEDRINEFWDNELFVKHHHLKNRLIFIKGDITEDLWGIEFNDDNLNILNNIDYIIHNAANIRFDNSLFQSYLNIINPIIQLHKLTSKCPNLIKVLFISTAYVCPPSELPIEPKLEKLPFEYQDFINKILQSNQSNKLIELKDIDTYHNNTYTLSKSIAEHYFINNIEKGYILRPSIISCSLKFPYPRYNDSYGGNKLVYFSDTKNILNYVYMPVCLNYIPVDIVVEEIYNNINININNKISFIASNNGIHSELGNDYYKEKVFVLIFYLFNKKYYTINKNIHDNYDFYCNNFWNFKTSYSNECYYLNYENNIYINSLEYEENYYDKHKIAGYKFNDISFSVFENFGYLWLIFLFTYIFGFYGLIVSYMIKYLTFTGYKENFRFIERIYGFILNKLFNFIFDNITINLESLEKEIEKANKDDRPIVFISNHRSYCDWLILPYIFFKKDMLNIRNLRIVANDKFKDNYLVSFLMNLVDTIYINTDKTSENKLSYNKINISASSHIPILYFIEGTRSRNREFLLPKTGILSKLVDCKHPINIIPISITYQNRPDDELLINDVTGSNIIQNKKFVDLKKLYHWIKYLYYERPNYGNVHIEFCKTLVLDNKTNINELANNIMQSMMLNTVVWKNNIKKEYIKYFYQKNIKIISYKKDNEYELSIGKNESINNWKHLFYKELKENDLLKYKNMKVLELLDNKIPIVDINIHELKDLIY